MSFQSNAFQSNVFQSGSAPDHTNPQPGYAELEPFVPVEIYPFVPYYLIQNRKLGIAAFTAAPVTNNPIPNQDQLNNLVAVLATWQPDYSLIPQLPRNLPPAITAVPVNNPIPNQDQLNNLVAVLAAWNPDPVHQYIHRAGQPYDYIKLVQPGVSAAKTSFTSQWLSTVLSAWQPPDPQPILPRNMSPGIPGMSVNNPAPNQDQLNNLVGILSAWNPEPTHTFIHKARQPYDYAKNSPGIPGMSVDNPPRIQSIQQDIGVPYSWQPPDPLPQRGPLFPQTTVRVQTPYANFWQVTVLQAWQPADPPPTLPRLLNPQITAVRVDNPPGAFAFSVYSPPDYPLPQVSSKFPIQPQVSAQVTFANYWLSTVLSAWQSPDPQPILPKQLSPGIPGMSVDNPPLGPTDFEYSIPSQTFPWNPFYLRQIARGTTRGGPTPFIPVTNFPQPNQDQLINLMGILAAWNPEPVHYYIHKAQQPYDYAKLPPQITNVPVNNPPFTSRTSLPNIIQAWQPPDPQYIHRAEQPYDYAKLSPGIPGQSVDNPPFNTRPQQVYYPVEDIAQQKRTFTPQTTTVSAEGPYANFWQVTVLQAWQPPDPQPILPKQLSPGIPGMSVDNPPLGPTDFEYSIPSQTFPWNPFYLRQIARGTTGSGPTPFIPVTNFPQPNQDQLVNLMGILAAWNPEPVHYYIHKAQQPYDYAKLNPSITNVPVNNPPFSGRDLLTNIIQAWQPPDPEYIHKARQPYDYAKNSPGIPGMSVDNPPGVWQQIPFEIDDGILPQTSRNRVIQGTTVTVQSPYSNAWLSTVLTSWQPVDQLPTLPRNLNPSITAVPVNNPPFTQMERIENQLRIITNVWLPPDPLPTLNVKFNFGVRVDNPPFGSRTELPGIIYAWQPPDPQYIHRAGQPYDYLKINPGIPGVSVDNPPFTNPGRTVQSNVIIYNTWIAPDPLPTLNFKFTAGTRSDNPPFTYWGRTAQYSQIVYNAWIPPDPPPTLNVKLPPSLSAVRVDNPPFSSRNQLPNILLFWQPPDPLPTRSVTLKIVISATAVPKNIFEWLIRARRRGRR